MLISNSILKNKVCLIIGAIFGFGKVAVLGLAEMEATSLYLLRLI
ncbi:MAG: hypothetical protein ACXABU_09810 [Candidatus Hodarchaeales archaeon]